MKVERFREISNQVVISERQSINYALFTVWDETKRGYEDKIIELSREIKRLENLVQGRDADGVLIPGKPLQQL